MPSRRSAARPRQPWCCRSSCRRWQKARRQQQPRRRLLQEQGDDPTVERRLLAAVKADPAFFRARISLARFYCCTAKTKRLDKAEQAAMEAIRMDPASASVASDGTQGQTSI